MRTIDGRGLRRSKIRHLTISLAGLLSLSACLNQPIAEEPRDAPAAISQPDIQAFIADWSAYADEVNEVPRQADCQPRLLPAAQSVQRRGAVVMIHGFGGCPQQFMQLGGMVAAQGFDVLLPLLPGHGAMPAADGADDLSRLPTGKDGASRYVTLAHRMNTIISKSPGEKVIVGFSLGGAISLNANLQERELYDRQLLLSPMFAIRGGAFVEGLTKFLGKLPAVKNMVVKRAAAREECRQWQAAGRAGFCDYRVKHAAVLLDLEDQNRELYEQQPFKEPVQIVAAGNEAYISNDEIVDFTERHRPAGPISLCFMPDDVPHEMLSPYENANVEMHWLPDLLRYAVSFITEGQFFPAETGQNEKQRPDCVQSNA
jgi:alpha-beta hydrolase superfamily lysophospholipase